MSKRSGLILVLAIAALFLLMNRAAYKGYFTDDDFEHLSWTRHAPVGEFIKGLLTPAFQSNNFRPAGHLLYHEEWNFFGFDFKKFLLTTHVLHLLNVWLVWLLARRLGSRPFAAAAGCVLFALHTGYFEAVWKPAYIFDVLCATFCLLSLLCWIRGRWLLSFICFWLAYKSKELAVMAPFVLAAYEIWYGEKRWKPLVPFFVASFSFALQALVLSPTTGDTPYTFHFTLDAIALTSVFYAGRIFLVPYLGFLMPVAARFSGNRRIWFGTAVMVLFFVPMLFLPGRIETAYCYLPFTGLAIAAAGAADMCPPAIVVACFLLFAPLEIHDLRIQRRDKLAKDDDARIWVNTFAQYASTAAPVDTFFWNGAPYGFGAFGIESAIKCLYPHDHFEIRFYEKPPVAVDRGHVAVLTWTPGLHQLDVVEHLASTPDASYIDTNLHTPVWQLLDGWSNPEGGFRWIAPLAKARIERPAGANHLELRVLANTTLIQNAKAVTVKLSLNDVELPPKTVTQVGWQVLQWDVPSAPPGPSVWTIRTDPPFRAPGDPRTLGIAVGSFGFR